MQLLKVLRLLTQKQQSLTAQPKEATSKEDDDDKTVIVDTNPTGITYGKNIKSFKLLIEKYKDYPNSNTIDDFEKEDQIHIKGFIKALGISANTKILETLRKKASKL